MHWFSVIYAHRIVTFSCHFFSNCHFLTVTKSVQIGRFGASIVNFARCVTFAQSDTLESVHFRDTEKLFFPNKHWGSEPILTFRNATNLHKIWIPLFCVVTLHSQACSYTLHFGGQGFRRHSDIIPKEHRTHFRAIH